MNAERLMKVLLAPHVSEKTTIVADQHKQFVFKVFNFIISAIRRGLVLFIVCCILGVVGSYIYYWQTPRYYDIEMIVQSNGLSKRTYYEIIKSLNGLVTSQSYDNFSSQLKLYKLNTRPETRQVRNTNDDIDHHTLRNF